MAQKIFSFPDGSAIIGTISGIVDAAGFPAKFNLVPTWVSSDPSVFAPTVAPDGLSCTGTVLKSGAVTVTVTGDGTSESVTLNAAAGAVVSFSVDFALAPATDPAPPPPPPGA